MENQKMTIATRIKEELAKREVEASAARAARIATVIEMIPDFLLRSDSPFGLLVYIDYNTMPIAIGTLSGGFLSNELQRGDYVALREALLAEGFVEEDSKDVEKHHFRIL